MKDKDQKNESNVFCCIDNSGCCPVNSHGQPNFMTKRYQILTLYTINYFPFSVRDILSVGFYRHNQWSHKTGNI